METQLSWCLVPANETAEGWLLGRALSYAELSCERGWMARGVIKSIDLLLPVPSLAARKDLIDGSCPGAQHAGGLVIKHALAGVDKAGRGDRQGAGIDGEKRAGGYCWYRCRCPRDGRRAGKFPTPDCCLSVSASFCFSFPLPGLPQAPVASRGKATSLVGSPSPRPGVRQRHAEQPPPVPSSGLSQGSEPDLGRLPGGAWGAFLHGKQQNLGLGSWVLFASGAACFPAAGKGAPLGAGAGSAERGRGDRSKVTSLGELWGLVGSQGQRAALIPGAKPTRLAFACASTRKSGRGLIPMSLRVKAPSVPSPCL